MLGTGLSASPSIQNCVISASYTPSATAVARRMMESALQTEKSGLVGQQLAVAVCHLQP